MRSQKIRLKPTKEQERLMWWYSKVSRNYWNLLVDIDRRNNKGEFDEILSERGNKTYHSKFHDREVHNLSLSDYHNLAKIVVAENYDKDSKDWSWYYQPNQSFIYAFLSRELVKIRHQNKGKLNFRSISNTPPSFNVRCDISANKKVKPNHFNLNALKSMSIPNKE